MVSSRREREVGTIIKKPPNAVRGHRHRFRVAGLRWWIAGLLLLATVISYLDRMTLSVLAPIICVNLHLSNLQYAAISVWFLFAYSIGQTVFGNFQDRIGTKRGLSIAMVIWSVAEIAQAMSRGLLSLTLLRVVLGFGEGGHWPASIKSVAEWFPRQQRGIGMGIVNTGATLGSAIAPPLIVWLQLSFGWRATFVVTGMCGLVWLVLWSLCYEVPAKHGWIEPSELAFIQQDAEVTPAVVPPSWKLLRDPRVRGIVLARLLGDPVWWLYLIWLPLYLSQARGLNLKQIGASAWIPFLCADAGALIGGWFSGWLIKHGWNPGRARGLAILIATAMAPVGMLIGGAKTGMDAIALISVELFAFQFWVNNVQTVTSDLFPKELVASVSGLAGTGAGVGSMIFILSTGWIVDHFGYSPVLILSGFLVPAATLALWNGAKSEMTKVQAVAIPNPV